MKGTGSLRYIMGSICVLFFKRTISNTKDVCVKGEYLVTAT